MSEETAPMVVTLLRQPVLARAVTDDGKLKRNGYERSKEPLEKREERLIRLESRTRALVSWDIANAAVFSLGTGRCIGNANWLLSKESLKALRKLSRELFPKEEKESDVVEETNVAEALAPEATTRDP